MTKVLFVCLGNICRSPLAEGLFNQALIARQIDHTISCDSCGTSNYHIGDLPDGRTREHAFRNGLELNHRARQFCMDDFQQFDFILAMDRENLTHLKKLQKENNISHKNLTLMRQFDPLKDHSDVPDPYYGGQHGFQVVYDILFRSSHHLLEYVISQTK